jgi:hypothetical protein
MKFEKFKWNFFAIYVYLTQSAAGCSNHDCANSGLKVNLLFYFMYFCTSFYFKTSEKTTTDPGKISKEIFPNL